jgi:VanZ family protein
MLALVLILAIFGLSARPVPDVLEAELRQPASYAFHVVAYALLAFVLQQAHGRPDFGAMVLTVLGVVLYGSFNELVQAFVPARTASLSDIGLDAVGAVVGVTASRIFTSVTARR